MHLKRVKKLPTKFSCHLLASGYPVVILFVKIAVDEDNGVLTLNVVDSNLPNEPVEVTLDVWTKLCMDFQLLE